MQLNKKLKWFTLVEMLIVIVIIWVLAAALIPRLTSVRWRANDVARRADLQQIATAIVSFSMDKGQYPRITWWAAALAYNSQSSWASVMHLSGVLRPYINSLPEDPSGKKYVSDFKEYGTTTNGTSWNYAYMTLKRWWGSDNWFALISIAESEWWANRLWTSGSHNNPNNASFASWRRLFNGDEANDIIPCTSMTKFSNTPNSGSITMWWECRYWSDSQLRYIIVR
jgi:type II secretion system protein G